ncbi:MAG: aldehyde dehydrogenase family protein [Anaerolineae bacterium]|nr:aldehyde dehydrogenase family protein [Anaerolineae bacterium]
MIAGDVSASSSLEEHPDIVVRNPITDEIVGTVPNFTPEQIAAIAERARAAQPAWEGLGVRRRAHILRAWADLLWEQRAKMMKIIRSETGKNRSGALSEIFGTDFTVTYYYHRAARILRSRRAQPLFPVFQRLTVHYRAHGLVGIIAPWNYPLLLVASELVPALIAGNAVILKPSELTPHTSLFIAELMHRVGVPQEILHVVTGDGTAGAAVIDVVDYIHVTGSTATGRKVAVRAAERLIPYSLELGSKDPLIILRDSNLDLAATGALKGALENAGQACVSTERVYVEDAIYEPFVERVRHHAKKIRVGPGDGMNIHTGSLTHERELVRVERHLDEAVAKGAKIILGGKRRPDLGPLFFEPTVIVDVDHTMALMKEETFGPILPIMRVQDADEAIRLANDSAFGLSGSIYTRDLKRGEQLARRIRTGDVGINRTGLVTIGTPGLPSGGEKDSGIGRRNGEVGLLRFVKSQSVLTDKLIYNPAQIEFLDPLTLVGVHAIRILRRWLPFI